MKTFILAVLASTICFFAGCASPMTVAVSDACPVRPTYEQGVAVLRSQKQNAVVIRLLTEEFTKETNALPAFFVAFSNGADGPVDFSTANIEAYSGGSRVQVYSYESLAKRIKHEASMQAFAIAMAGASQSMAAAMPQTTSTYGTASAYGSGGYARASYTGYSTTYNPAATAAANAQINANTMNQMSMIASSRNIQIQGLGSMLRRNTVPPGEIAAGVVKLHAEDILGGQILKVVVNLGSESHEFLFDVRK